MSLHGSPRFVRSLVASLLMLGLIAITIWTVQQRPSSARAAAASLVQVTNFGTNPTGLQMWLYVPPSVKPRPPILLALHYCTGTGPVFFSNTEFANLADQYGFIVIYPSATRSGQCWDVSSSQSLSRNGGSDPVGLMSMVTYVEQHNNGDPNSVYVTGASSGAMMTNVLLADYPDVFKAGAAFMGVPYHCFATTDGSLWNSACANGQISMTPQQWGDLARAAFPGYNGSRPRMQLWHGTADTTLNYANLGEEIKQWTNVLGVSQTPSFTDSPQSGWTRTRYGGTGIGAPVEGISIQGVGHSLPLSGMAAYAIQFMGLNTTSGSTPTPTPPPGSNLLTNGDTEAGTTGWAVFGSGTLTSNTSVVHGGTRSLLLTGRTAAWNGISQTVTSKLTNGRSYTTNVWVRAQSGTPSAKVTLALTVNGSTSYITLAPGKAVNSSGWTLLSGTATVSWSGTLSSAVWYVETTSGTNSFYIDDASFK
ncbi:MAG: PHB depolymerase family esterase [Ktedonobacteraceae bacterium]|nr:PHB depolymerase family esterase [Ktedonobacteraceae bacterium]